MKINPMLYKEITEELYNCIDNISEAFYTEDGSELLNFDEIPVDGFLEARKLCEEMITSIDEKINELKGK